MQHLHRWVRRSSTLYIGTTEPPAFFASLVADGYTLVFSSNFSSVLEGITNNYALYAIESLVHL